MGLVRRRCSTLLTIIHSFLDTTFVTMKFLAAFAALTISSSSATVLPYGVHPQLSKREVNGSYIPSTAPYDNIFADISGSEEKSIQAFLRRQKNVTMWVQISYCILNSR